MPDGTMTTDNDVQRRPLGLTSSPSLRAQQGGRFDTAELFGGETEIEITHRGTVYRLKITRQGKLILNK